MCQSVRHSHTHTRLFAVDQGTCTHLPFLKMRQVRQLSEDTAEIKAPISKNRFPLHSRKAHKSGLTSVEMSKETALLPLKSGVKSPQCVENRRASAVSTAFFLLFGSEGVRNSPASASHTHTHTRPFTMSGTTIRRCSCKMITKPDTLLCRITPSDLCYFSPPALFYTQLVRPHHKGSMKKG